MSFAPKPIFFRAVHTGTRWRKARHETFANARSVGNRSARALFRGENDAIKVEKHGEARFVIIWAEGATSGEVLRPDASSTHGLEAVQVSIDDIVRWEAEGGASDAELSRYFEKHGDPIGAERLQLTDRATRARDPETSEQLEAVLQAAIRESRGISDHIRKARLLAADPVPRLVQVHTTAFLRNADVIVEVLKRANGKCECCGEGAPFLRASDGSPYLEVHHVLPLARGGHDSVENAQALCPTCHRRIHFGYDAT